MSDLIEDNNKVEDVAVAVEEEEEEVIVWKTAPYDPRFPNCNQTKNCWQNFVDYQKCLSLRDEEDDACKEFKARYRSLCPSSWVSQHTTHTHKNTNKLSFRRIDGKKR